MMGQYMNDESNGNTTAYLIITILPIIPNLPTRVYGALKERTMDLGMTGYFSLKLIFFPM
jgi:hypothetical protein